MMDVNEARNGYGWRCRGNVMPHLLHWRIAVETISLCLMACAPVVSAKLSQYAIDDVIGMRSVTNFRLLLILCVFYIAVFIALKYSIAWVSATTRQRFALDVREHFGDDGLMRLTFPCKARVKYPIEFFVTYILLVM